MAAARKLSQEHTSAACERGTAALGRAFEFLGKRWNGVLLGTLRNGPAGFRELSRAVDGISDSVLSDRLSDLAAAGLTTRTSHAIPHEPQRHDWLGAAARLSLRSVGAKRSSRPSLPRPAPDQGRGK